jgi:BirA family biotin operon repressor/biotin-[acetyl-CoA-carboxylase] ligase
MVNEKKGKTRNRSKSGVSTRAFILGELQKDPGKPVSGEALAQKLGITRVSVWKAVKALIQSGYPVKKSGAGYSIGGGLTDSIHPWAFGASEALFHHFESTNSTMDRARELALEGCPAGTIVTAEKQYAGRGRNGRTWTSRQGGLYFTIVERPALPVNDYLYTGLALQIAAARVLSKVCGKEALLRWPNDIYINQRKIAGLITELAAEGDRLIWLAAGIGVNVNNPVPSAKSASCMEITGKQVSRREVLSGILKEYEAIKKEYASNRRGLTNEWNSRADRLRGKAAAVEIKHGETKDNQALSAGKYRVFAKGTFAGIDLLGRCVIKGEGQGAGTTYFNPGAASIVFLN